MSYADRVFKETVKNILENGVYDNDLDVRPRWEDGTPAHTVAVFGVVNRYDLKKEFPIMTLRRTYWKSAWDEISWIWQKKSNRVSELKTSVWDAWADENGTIGKAYGFQMGEKAKYRDVTEAGIMKAFGRNAASRLADKTEDGIYMLDQTDRVIYQLVNDHGSRRILTNLYNIGELNEMALAPCAYSMTFMVVGNKLNAILNQRSQDMITANNWNVVQYALVVYAMASAYGFEPGELVHVIGNCHIYDRHIELAKEMLNNEEFDAPRFLIDGSVKDFYDFTPDSFKLEDYRYNDFNHVIPVAI